MYEWSKLEKLLARQEAKVKSKKRVIERAQKRRKGNSLFHIDGLTAPHKRGVGGKVPKTQEGASRSEVML